MRLCIALLFLFSKTLATFALDLTRAVIVTEDDSPRIHKAAVMLTEEVEKRTGVQWPIAKQHPAAGESFILLREKKTDPAEGFTIRAEKENVSIDGNDERGVMFGVGRLLRELRMTRGKVALEDGFTVTTAPKYPLRGHQLGYRPKTHSYDAWDLKTWEQYYRDLIVFGANAVELIPPRSDDDADSPHFPLPPMEMMIAMSRLADEYGLDVWIWYPAMDKNYADPKTVEFALKEWAQVFSKLPRIDVVYVPGGDPGHTQPKYLMALLEKQTESLRKYHPKAEMWVSPQSFNKEWLAEFFEIVKTEPKWLGGIVFGPQVRISLPELRKAIPEKYPIRHYPDITHSRQCQYPVPDWDVAFAITEGRECINPRPIDESAIFKLLQPYTIGFLTYSEGCNDDVNKAIWSG
ncbi:MAG TPA: glycoside hydrolase family 20 zincin-like fold domain-containing protein, partial [Verrucomicrobiae bacterium]